jgi:hypothetical protein
MIVHQCAAIGGRASIKFQVNSRILSQCVKMIVGSCIVELHSAPVTAATADELGRAVIAAMAGPMR